MTTYYLLWLERNMKETVFDLFAVKTSSGKIHLTTRMYVNGMMGSVPRTLCYSMIKRCSYPEPFTIDEEKDICIHCLKVWPEIEELRKIEINR